MVSLCPLQREKASHKKIANLETATNFGRLISSTNSTDIQLILFVDRSFDFTDRPLEAFQLRQQQMGEIAKSGQFSVQRFRSNAISRFGSARDHPSAQRVIRTEWYHRQFDR